MSSLNAMKSMATTKRGSIRFLTKQILAISLHEIEPEVVSKQIKKITRLARFYGDIDHFTKVRLQRGEYYLHLNKPARAGKIFLSALRSGIHEIEAMTGIAESYFLSNKKGKANQWLQKAFSYAKERYDYQGQLKVLDFIGNRLVITQRNPQDELLRSMSELMSHLPKADIQFQEVVRSLLHMKRGAECVHYLEACVHRLLVLNATYHQYKDNLYLLVNAYRQTGLANKMIKDKLLTFMSYCADESTLNDFIRRIDRDIERSPYPTLADDQIDVVISTGNKSDVEIDLTWFV